MPSRTLRSKPSIPLDERLSTKFDPYGFFDKYVEEGIKHERNVATEVLPRLVYEYIPSSLIKSFALAFDPLWRFKVSPVKVTPANRTRKRTRDSVLLPRKWNQFTISKVVSKSHTLMCKPIYAEVNTVTVNANVSLSAQTNLASLCRDTTSRTRPAGSLFGEFENFEFSIRSPTRQIYSTDRTFTALDDGCPSGQSSESTAYHYTANTGDAATLSTSSLEALRVSELSALSTLMSKKIIGMLPKVIPDGRRYSLFRNLVELRDVPHSVSQLRTTVQNFQRLTSVIPRADRSFVFDLRRSVSDIPKEYLSYNFGWKQVYNDLMDLMATPDRITRDINKLILRSGKPTAFRLKHKFALDGLTSPGFAYDVYNGETSITSSTLITRDVELRLVVNAIFDFPTIDIPQFKRDLFLKKLGVLPTATDIYNLTPWTWLLDWFTGLGNYIECIDAINTDRSLFNWGFLTGVISGRLVTTRSSKVTDFTQVRINNGPLISTQTVKSFTHSSECLYKLTVRKNIASSFGVKSLLEQQNLSAYQKSIIGALVADRSGSIRSSRTRGD